MKKRNIIFVIAFFMMILGLASCNNNESKANESKSEDIFEKNKYTIIWKNYDGVVLEEDKEVEYGTVPSYDGKTPSKPSTAQYTYTFNNWDSEVTTVTGDKVYTAQFIDYTQTPFALELVMEEATDGSWQVTYLRNYKEYLDTVAPLQNKDIADYIDATQGIVDNSNAEFRQQQQRFQNLVRTSTGKLSEGQKSEIRALLLDEVIPSLKKRQQKLDAVDVPAGAAYLARLRQQSTETTIKTWQHFVKALREDKPVEFETAETLHKQQLEIDLRIEDIIKHTAVSKNIPNIP